MIGIIDYKMGNLGSVKKAFKRLNIDSIITNNYKDLLAVNKIVLPGVGNFDPAVRSIRDYSAIQFKDFVKDKTPVLGICLGMEMFFAKSEEGKEKGLDILNGEVILLPKDMKIPHMGWNSLQIRKQSKLLDGVDNGSWVYFVHSYRAKPLDEQIVVADADYGIRVPAVVEKGIYFGTQFHPEKSGKVGSLMIRNFLREYKQ